MFVAPKFLTWRVKPQQLLFSGLVGLAFTVAQPFAAKAQPGACGDAPVVDDVRFKGELDAKLQFLSRFIGDAGLKGQVDYAREDVLRKYPNADKLRLNQYVLYVLCMAIMADTKMSTPEKLRELRQTRTEIFSQ